MPMTKAAMQAAIADPSTGSIRRRWLRRALAGIVAVGPSKPPAAPHPPTHADRVRFARRVGDTDNEHREIVASELRAIDQRLAEVERLLAARPSGARVGYEFQELRSERHRLRDLRNDIEMDEPVHDRDGQPLDKRWRAIRRDRTRSLRESYWAAAEAARAEGDHRRARQLRLDALRARHLAEVEFGWRNLTHYW